MTTFLLVHGSWHGAWCWYKVVAELEARGHRALAVDLPGHGRNPAAARDVSLRTYVDAVCAVLDFLDGSCILVAHSRGGIVASQVGEARPGKVDKLVYLAAFMVPSGHTALEYALSDTESLVQGQVDVNREEGWDMLRAAAFRDALYHDCTPEDIALCRLLLAPEPLRPGLTPLDLSPSRFGSIPRYYIELLQDRAVTPAVQKRMYSAMDCERVIAIDASHSAYFSRAGELAEQLVGIL